MISTDTGDNPTPTLKRQCELLDISRATYYQHIDNIEITPSSEDLELKNKVLEIYAAHIYYGARRMSFELRKAGHNVGRKKARRLMKELNIRAICPGPETSKPNKQHKKYPYLLRDVKIDRPDKVWCTDITYIRINGGWVYLVAVLDWHSRKVLSWRLSNSLDTNFCIEALNDALSYGTPDIFNTDQGAQFTSTEFTDVLIGKGIKVSMDGKGRALDNVIVERFWRNLKYESIYINDYRRMGELRGAIADYIDFYNNRRPHQTHDYMTPSYVYGA